MDEYKRKARTISMNDAELTITKNVMDFYRMHSISETVRFLILRENAKIEVEKANRNEVK